MHCGISTMSGTAGQRHDGYQEMEKPNKNNLQISQNSSWLFFKPLSSYRVFNIQALQEHALKEQLLVHCINNYEFYGRMDYIKRYRFSQYMQASLTSSHS